MTEARGPWFERPFARTAAVLALLAYLPSLTAAPGRMPSDSKLYLYLDPGRFMADAASSFDGRQFAGWVPHQHIAYLWPSTPWFWVLDTVGVPDWIAHRLWIGTIMLAAGLGVRWCARLLGLGAMAAFTAAIVYQLSLYVLPYVSRTSVMLLPWAGLGWIVALTVRATRRRTWADPAMIALVVLTVGAVNATALAMIVPAPVLWLVHAAWQRSVSWRDAVVVAARTGVLSLAVSAWWIAMLVVQGRYGTDVLPYSESLADVSLTATSAETWRGLGYWLFYVRDPYAATTTESLRYLSSSVSIAVSYAVPLLALVALVWGRWAHRRFAAGLIGVGLVLAVGVHPIADRSPLMRVFAGDDERGLALALRSSTRALPMMLLGVALALAMAVDAARHRSLPRLGAPGSWAAGAGVALLAIVNLPSIWIGAFVDPSLERDQDPPSAWLDAVDALDASGDAGRVLQLPGAEFGAYRWGYTVDQPLPGLTGKPLVTRDLLPLGSPGAMDLLYALDDRAQDGVLEPDAIAPVARLLGVDTIWLTNDLAFDRFRTARPEIVRDIVAGASGVGELEPYGELFLNRPDVPMTDERAVGDPRVGEPLVPVELAPIEAPGRIVRAGVAELVVSGSGDGLVDAAAAGLLDADTVVRYSADRLEIEAGDLQRDVGLVVTDSNRDRARHWRSSQDTTGYTEPGGADQGVLRPVAADARLELFPTSDPETQTIARQRGPVRATATSYGEPFAYLPEHRPAMAIDGDADTAWLVGEHGDPIGETLRLEFDDPVDRVLLRQPSRPGDRRITRISFDGGDSVGTTDITGTAALDETSTEGAGQEITIGTGVTVLDITIDEVAGGTPFTASAVAPVGFAEADAGLGPTIEVVRPPVDGVRNVVAGTPLAVALTRLRVDPMDRWRNDPEPMLIREIELDASRDFDLALTVRIDARAPDVELAELFGWAAVASTRLTGSPRHAGVAALDDDPSTTWITAFGAAEGATLATTSSVPIDAVEVRQPVTGFSRITALLVRAGGEERLVELVPDAAGGATGAVDPPLPAGPVEFVLSDVDTVTTVDRRFGDPVALPAAIAELWFEGRSTARSVEEATSTLRCVPLVTVDDEPLLATITVDDAGWLDGEPIAAEPCAPTIGLDGGAHLIVGSDSGLPVHVDRIVLDDGVRDALDALPPAPPAVVVDEGRFERSIRVGPCPNGCWAVLGVGLNEAWAASIDGGDLGPPTQLDGGFNGWWVAPSAEPTLVTVRWTAQRTLTAALLLSAMAASACAALLVAHRRRSAPVAGERRPIGGGAEWGWPAPSLDVRTALATSGLWVAAAVVLIGPEWALGAVLGGAAVVLLRRQRIPELTALAGLLVVATVVVGRERRAAPPPGGGWPGTFESLHGLGMFAVACVVVAAIVADDAAGTTDDEVDEVDGIVATDQATFDP